MFSKKLEYRSLPNIRDLGGMRTKDGRQIAPGKLIRCGHLSGLSRKDTAEWMVCSARDWACLTETWRSFKKCTCADQGDGGCKRASDCCQYFAWTEIWKKAR